MADGLGLCYCNGIGLHPSVKCNSSFPHFSSFFYPFYNLFLLVCEKRSGKLIK